MEPFGYANATTEGYVNANGDWPTARVNFPIIRFAEMMLFRAEAYLMKNQPDKAWKDLNRIHVRACGLSLPSPATMEQLYHERRCELAFEFTDHLFDLKRWHHSSNAEIKALAEKELNARPLVRHYKNRGICMSLLWKTCLPSGILHHSSAFWCRKECLLPIMFRADGAWKPSRRKLTGVPRCICFGSSYYSSCS